ncbi:tripartite tricarboxylate transporter substrate binding protein [Pigmentiphaga sp. GD03639]|uniref:Tripartite tricarboxylate transporter substrate binding protein n=1 Tax=Pigmentiphaga daeguensis TaxID=414049 RepID=A0ABN1BQS0_9BURK|nr:MULTISPECIES: tripartite tricarboxylate transporter substrate binding protein [unclassified Pigmentiphaga]MDH2235349.1 tripartite tricarboxylate transporter substrate binding protein [Pigmentiphaga sp. GD03639]
MTSVRLVVLLAALAGAASLPSAPALAQGGAYPNKPIRVIVPFPAGGTTDVVARLIGAQVGEAWSQSVVVDNVAGASGLIGTAAGVRAAPDGYVLTLGNNQTHSTNASLFPKIQFDLNKDVQPIALLTRTRHAIVVPASSPYRTLSELIQGGRGKPVNYASSSPGSSSHLVSETLCSSMKMRCTHIPYKGAAPAVTDLIAGHVDFMTASYASAIAYIKAGKLRALAISGDTREAQAPDVPTLHELGYETLSADSWIGLYAPAGTPRAILTKWSDELARVMAQPDIQQKLAGAGFEPWFKPLAQFEEFHRNEIARWRKMVQTAGVTLE